MPAEGTRADLSDRRERGSTTLWTLGLALTLFMVGAISVDLWRALAEHRELAGIADAAAVAASSGIDVDGYRTSGDVLLDYALAHEGALRAIAAQPGGSDLSAPPAVQLFNGNASVRVSLERVMDLGLLRLLAPGQNIRIVVNAEADAALRT